MPKWPFGSQKVKVECATKLRTTFAASCPPLTTPYSRQNDAHDEHCPKTQPSARQSPSQAGNGRPPCWSVCTHCTHWRALLVIPANKTFITIGYSGNVAHVGLLPTDRNANARDKQVEHFVRQRRPRLNQVASAVPLSVCLSLPTYERSRVPRQATALQLCQNFLAWPKNANKKGAKAAANMPW